MDELKLLESLGLVLPTPAYILGAIVFGIFGYVAFRHGKKQKRTPLVWTGVVLMLYPYAISETWLLWVIGAALSGWVIVTWNASE